MRERDMTGDERPNLEPGSVRQDDSGALPSVEPAGQRRRPRSKASAAERGAADFNPTSRGDEHGEVM